jgi:hypothetical protein
MTLFSWFDTLRSGYARRRQARRGQRRLDPPKTRALQLVLEKLDDRIVPSTNTWVGGSGDWETASHWSTGSLPGPADDVTIAASGITVTHTSSRFDSIHSLTVSSSSTALNISGGTLKLAAASSISGALTLSTGTLTGAGSITVAGVLTWSGGTMSGTGSVTLPATATLNLGSSSGAVEILDGRTFNNAAPASWLAGSGDIILEDGAVFNNQAGATFTVNCDAGIFPSGATGVFNNAGTFTKAAGTGTTTIDVIFNNTHTVNVSSGTLTLENGGQDTADSFTIASGSTLNFAGGNTAFGSSIGTTTTAQAGSVTFSGGTTDVTGTYNISGTTTVSGGTANFLGTLTSPGPTLTVSGGSANLGGNKATVATLNLTAGTLTGSGIVTVSGTLTWSGGTMSGAGSTTLTTTATLNLGSSSGAVEALDERAFTNSHAANWLAGSGDFILEDGAVFTNKTGATFTQNNDAGIFPSGATGTFTNGGTYTKAVGTGTSTIDVIFNSTGKVNVSSGNLTLEGGGIDKGTFTIALGSTLGFGGGNTAFGSSIGTTSVPQKGSVTFSGGTTTVTGTYNISGTTNVRGGTVTYLDKLTSLGTTLTVSGGTADFGSNNFTVATLNLTGGALTGSGAVTVTGTLTWSGGAMSGSGSTTLTAAATMNLGSGTGGDEALDTRTFKNNGAVTWLAGSGTIFFEDGAVFNNEAGASFTVNCDAGIFPSGAIGMFTNAGTFTKAAGTGTTTLDVVFNNTGTVNVASGTVLLESGGSGGGTFAAASGTTLTFGGGIFNLDAAPSTTVISGAGSVLFSASGETDVAGIYNITGGTSVTGGTVDFLNNVTTATFSNSGGTVIIDNPAAGTATFAVTGGDYTQSGGSTLLDGATLTVSAGHKIDVQQNTTFSGLGTVNGDFSNAANLIVGGSGTAGVLTVNGNYTQTSTGTLSIDIGGPSAGTQYDQLVIAGTGHSATLSGTLTLTLVNGYTPAHGTNFTIMTYPSESGDFATKNLGGLSSATVGATSYTATA